MSALNQVIAGIGGAVAKSWTFVGASALTTVSGASGSNTFPETAQAGDVAILFLAGSGDFNTVSGYTLTASGQNILQHKICTGGETSVSWSAGTSTSRKSMLALFRPSGGTATFTGGVGSSVPGGGLSDVGPITYTSLPTLLIFDGSSVSSITNWGYVGPSGPVTLSLGTSAASQAFLYSVQQSGANTGPLNLYDVGGVGYRQAFGAFHIV